MSGRTLSFRVDGYEVSASFAGYEVSASFAGTPNRSITHHLKQILMASFVNNTSGSASGDILAAVPKRRYNQDGDHHCAP